MPDGTFTGKRNLVILLSSKFIIIIDSQDMRGWCDFRNLENRREINDRKKIKDIASAIKIHRVKSRLLSEIDHINSRNNTDQTNQIIDMVFKIVYK